jgi:YgiT-type zinc finger domain-containing protein
MQAETIAMKCLACKNGTLKAGRTTVTVERDGTTIVIHNVPANVCETCGEDYLDAAVASSLETVLQEAARSGVRFEVREYQAA